MDALANSASHNFLWQYFQNIHNLKLLFKFQFTAYFFALLLFDYTAYIFARKKLKLCSLRKIVLLKKYFEF
jgi:hypothetical protein